MTDWPASWAQQATIYARDRRAYRANEFERWLRHFYPDASAVQDERPGVPTIGPCPPPTVTAHPVSREGWPPGLRTMLGVTAKRIVPVLAPGWRYRVLRAVGFVERATPRRWVAVESVSLRLRGPLSIHTVYGHQLGAVVIWHRDVVWLRHPGRHKPKPAEWKSVLCKCWPLDSDDDRPADIPRDIAVAELKAMIRKGST